MASFAIALTHTGSSAGLWSASARRYGRSVTVGAFRCSSLESGMHSVVRKSGRLSDPAQVARMRRLLPVAIVFGSGVSSTSDNGLDFVDLEVVPASVG